MLYATYNAYMMYNYVHVFIYYECLSPTNYYTNTILSKNISIRCTNYSFIRTIFRLLHKEQIEFLKCTLDLWIRRHEAKVLTLSLKKADRVLVMHKLVLILYWAYMQWFWNLFLDKTFCLFIIVRSSIWCAWV